MFRQSFDIIIYNRLQILSAQLNWEI